MGSGAAGGGASDVGRGCHQLGNHPDSAACRSALGRRPGGADKPNVLAITDRRSFRLGVISPPSSVKSTGRVRRGWRRQRRLTWLTMPASQPARDWYLRPMTTPDVVRKVWQLDNDVQSIYEMLAKLEATQNRHGNRLGEIATTIGEMDTKIGEMDGKLNDILDLLRQR